MGEKRMRVVLVAVPGSGKSTTIQLIQKKNPNIRRVVFGDYMAHIAKKKFGLKRDEMRKRLGPEDYKKLQYKAAKEIGTLKDDVIIDTHSAIKTSYGYYPGLPVKVLEEIKPDVIVLMEFDPEVVLQRRKKDLEKSEPQKTKIGTMAEPRQREMETRKEIEMNQTVNREMASVYAVLSSAYLKIINLRYKEKRPFEHTEKAAEELLKFFRQSFL